MALWKCLRMHLWRRFVADLLVVVCFALAVVSAVDDNGDM